MREIHSCSVFCAYGGHNRAAMREDLKPGPAAVICRRATPLPPRKTLARSPLCCIGGQCVF